jgi:hypothetical protein
VVRSSELHRPVMDLPTFEALSLSTSDEETTKMKVVHLEKL